MKRTKRMLIVLLTSFSIFALLTFLTFSSYGQNITSQKNYILNKNNKTVQNTLNIYGTDLNTRKI
ncbi:hypothetical protein Fleli_0715 [Bernardetia litoralis DSM 6794]|uniref:Uncharacterized protein n=1 Tax=Bernardetia litoralis (strain ATCC 23117 / DSM 6794 / NBRC 15988 / NCIMB 1366 / Fx l1 / Sio-4) TaxID=880071 RepID=I4AGU1_BERLS|nr:hypothetical protein [Bernardetia litoralis]AFM03176.1 hypothetical protein Fleli_0715 [Bernardetia litoralis DSM 6794]